MLSPQYGVREGRFIPCPTSRACVSSQADEPTRHIEPLSYESERLKARDDLILALGRFTGVRIVSSHRNYIRAEFPSKVTQDNGQSDYYFEGEAAMDDVEFYFSPGEKVVHLRSASRLGVLDLGENRDRIEQLRLYFNSLQQAD